MKITRSTLLKASPYAALIAGFAGGALAVSPLAPQREVPANAGDPYLQLVQAEPLVRAAPSSRGEMQLSFAPVAARAGPAVVNVYAQRVVRGRGISRDPFFGRFGAPRIENSLGSGVIVRADGIIVTNNHVIEGAQSLKVVLADRREYDAVSIWPCCASMPVARACRPWRLPTRSTICRWAIWCLPSAIRSACSRP